MTPLGVQTTFSVKHLCQQSPRQSCFLNHLGDNLSTMGTRELSLNKETAVLEVAKDFYLREVAPVVVPNACILASRIITVALAKYNVQCWATQVDAVCWNNEGFRLRNDLNAFRSTPTAWSVGVMSEPSNQWVRNELESGSNPFDRKFYGHLIVETPNHFVDFTASQFDRPEKGIVTGSPLIVPNSRLTEVKDGWIVPIEQGVYVFRDAQHPASPQGTPDWDANYKRDAKRLIEELRPLLG